MNTPRTILLLIVTAFAACVARAADDKPPALSLSKAAKLAEEAITAAALPADCYLRSISLQQRPGVEPYYAALYKPGGFRRPTGGVIGGTGGGPVMPAVDVLRITMDGKVAFEKLGVPLKSLPNPQPATGTPEK